MMRCYRLCGNVINHYFNNNYNVQRKRCINVISRWNSTSSAAQQEEPKDLASSVKSSDVENEGDQFRYLLRESKFINMGDPMGKVVIGKVFHVIKDDLYVDFGWKFYCVCPRPYKNGELFVRGAKVYLRIKDLELSSRFLGSEKDLTLLEADGTIIGLQYSPVKTSKT